LDGRIYQFNLKKIMAKHKEELEKLTPDQAILKEAQDRLKACIDYEDNERAKMLDDLRFCTLDQWPAEIRTARENDPNGSRPCLTIDKINQYIVQVVNDMRHNRPGIKARPVDDQADPDTAEIYQGLIRHIEDQSNASVAYETAGESAVKIGLGYFRVMTDYVSPDSFDQEPRIKRIPNTFSTYLGPHIQPDGSDAEYGFIVEEMPDEKFEREFPKAKKEGGDFEGLGDKPTWKTEETTTVVEYFYTKYTNKTLLFLADGTTIIKEEYESLYADHPDAPQIQDYRTTHLNEIKWCKLTGAEVLEKRDWLGKYIPIVEVIGKEAYVDGKRCLWGLVRPAKDNLRMYNYWASAATEKIALSPKVPFIGAKGQFEGLEDAWKKANVENRAYLEYNAIDVNGNAIPAPQRVIPAPIETAIINMMGTIEHDVQTSLGMFKASVGESESQQSGKAILALQRESDTGTFHFQDNLALSIKHCGRILIDLIPQIIDTRRVLRILGEDGESQSVTVNPEQSVAMMQTPDMTGKVKRIYNLGVGHYDVTVTVGPSYTTARQEASTILTELANSAKDPISASVMRYLAIKNSDFHGSDEMVRMLKALLPPQLQQADGEQQPIPPQAMAQIQQLGQQNQMMKQGLQELAQDNQQLKSGVQEGMAKISANHDEKMKALALDEKVALEKARIAREQFEFEKQLEIDKANHEIDLEERKAVAAHGIKQKELEFEQTCRAQDQQEKTKLDNETGATALAPNMVESMKAMVEGLKEVSQTQQLMIEQMGKPKTVSMTMPDGRQASATVH
jgi:hypothetical protein